MCFNINWAKRSSCNQCFASKPGTTDSNREGFGGGFKDREDRVEYKETRFKKEEEYDAFGRRKKKKQLESTVTGTNNTNHDHAASFSTSAKIDSAKTEDDDDDGAEDDGRWNAWSDLIEDRNEKTGESNDSSRGEEREASRSSDFDRKRSMNRGGRDEYREGGSIRDEYRDGGGRRHDREIERDRDWKRDRDGAHRENTKRFQDDRYDRRPRSRSPERRFMGKDRWDKDRRSNHRPRSRSPPPRRRY
ncbi:hypothetical protein HDU76_011340 [Blyttiomyces sp. JEL0837]|nr:hypothetical protein HDU76_011340 [Blyttiomyces sp. JEL0837]